MGVILVVGLVFVLDGDNGDVLVTNEVLW